MAHWTASDIPSQRGRTVIITGTGGLGLEDALALAKAGADIIIAGRNPAKGAEAVSRVKRDVPNATVRFEQVDLASLRSVGDFAERIKGQLNHLDLLINNAGVMVPPTRQETQDGFELQLGTNYLSHFALTAHLLPLLQAAKSPRVVTLSSVAARQGKIQFDDINWETSYRAMEAYSQSKIACLIFALELQRRSAAAGWSISSLAAHPGVSRTELLHNAPGRWSAQSLIRTIMPFLFQPAWQGALPTLYAATAPDAQPGGSYGPHALGETRGYPVPSKNPPLANDRAVAKRLWEVSEEMTGVRFG